MSAAEIQSAQALAQIAATLRQILSELQSIRTAQQHIAANSGRR